MLKTIALFTLLLSTTVWSQTTQVVEREVVINGETYIETVEYIELAEGESVDSFETEEDLSRVPTSRRHKKRRGQHKARGLNETRRPSSSRAPRKAQEPANNYRFTISETNDAAIMGLQEAMMPEDQRPNDIGYTHGVRIEFENQDASIFDIGGSFKVAFTSDLYTEYTQEGGNSVLDIFNYDAERILALDVLRLGFEYETHPMRSGLQFFLGSGVEYITDTPDFAGSSFLSARERQASWHETFGSTIFTYHEEGRERYSINTQAGIGINRPFFGSVGTIKLRGGYLLKSSPNEQAQKESRFFGSAQIRLNDVIESANYYRAKEDRFIFFFGANGEYGEGQKLETFAGFSQNVSGFLGQFELSFMATLPVVQNFFDFSDFTTPKEFRESQYHLGGIIDYEPVYTLGITTMW